MSKQKTKSKTKQLSLVDDSISEEDIDLDDLKPLEIRKFSSVEFENVALQVRALQVDHAVKSVVKKQDFTDDLSIHFRPKRLKNLFNCMVQPKTIVEYETGQVIILYADYDFFEHFGKI